MADSQQPNPGPPGPRRLSRADAEALEAILAGEGADGPRGQRVEQVLALIERCPSESPDEDLVQRTLERTAEADNRRRLSQQVQMLADGPAAGGGAMDALRQFGAVAALVLISLSLLLPVLSHNEHIARQLACATNLKAAGAAFQSYAQDHGSVMPRGKIKPKSIWWNVGEAHKPDQPMHSNSAHLYILVRAKARYLQPEDLACPSNPHARPEKMTRRHHDWPSARAVSYSYQNQYTKAPIRLNQQPDLAVLADKNPLFIERMNRMHHDADRPETSPSRMHDDRGQNMLTANGAVRWTVRPMVRKAGLGEDNIWVVSGIERYNGDEVPSRPDDSFLVP